MARFDSNKVYDVDHNELAEDDVDLDKGYIRRDIVVTESFPGVPEISEQSHLYVREVHFDMSPDENGNMYQPISWTGMQDGDDRVELVDELTGQFAVKNKRLNVKGMTLAKHVDVEYQPAIPPYGSAETISVYIPYTQDELAQKSEDELRERIENSLTTLIPDIQKRLNEYKTNIEDVSAALDEIAVALAEMVGE